MSKVLNTRVQEKVSQSLYSRFQLAYICVDHSMIVQGVSSNLREYGFEKVDLGQDVTDVVDFMVGIDTISEISLPMLSSPTGIPITVNLLPDGELLLIVISNASGQASHRRQLQQAANENELLVDQQKKLMLELEAASSELEEKNLQLEEASRLQTSFLSGVSHEFRTPLTSIIGYTSLVSEDLQRRGDDLRTEEGNASYLAAVQRSSKHLLSLVENLLDHGKLDSDEIVVRPKVVSLVEIFDDVDVLMRPLGATKRITVDVQTDFPNDVQIVIDDTRLRQCLINLIGNAVKFTDEGSVVVQASWADDQLTVSIKDTGLGIGADDLKKIMLPFWQGASTGKAGTGLGLTITGKIIELMGGSMDIDSTLGQGTCVSFELPATQVEGAAIVADSLDVGSDALEKLNILLVEDDLDIASLLMMMLQDRGVQVTHVENGALALAAINEQGENVQGGLVENPFNLVLMDLNMPVMSGYEAIEALRAQGNNIPVLVMSASSIENNRERAEELGCDGYIVKPIEIDDLLSLANLVVG